MTRRGICLIINNYDFRKSPKYLKDREGTKVDQGASSYIMLMSTDVYHVS